MEPAGGLDARKDAFHLSIGIKDSANTLNEQIIIELPAQSV
jgi:hypothetical protein